MASYNKFNNNCLRDASIIPLVNCLTSFFCGFVIFSVLGFMAKEAGVPVSEVITSGPGLAFVVYPEALSRLPGGAVWSAMFFLMLIIVGLDTQFGMFETMVSGFCDVFPRSFQGRGRKVAFTAAMCIVQFLFGIPLITKGGIYIFQIFDWYSATFSLITVSFLECLIVGWIYGAQRLREDISLMLGHQPFVWWKICWMFITPIILFIVLIFTMARFTPPTYGTYEYPSWAHAIGWMLATISLVPIPTIMVFKIINTDGSFIERIKHLCQPSEEWGPALDKDRKGTTYADNTGTVLEPVLTSPSDHADVPV